MSKILFIENSPFLTRMVVSDELKESIQIKQGGNNTLIVKNIPATILNRGNQNGRIYSTKEMQKAIDAAKQQIETKQLLCQASEHPEGSFVSPTHASHVITNAYIKKNVKLEVEGESGTWDVLFCDVEVLNTTEGQNLQALLLSGCSIGTSIRGLGDMQGDQVVNYEFLGFDVVSNPSSGTFTNMPIYEAKVESIDKRSLDEATRYTISTYASNTTHDLQQAIEFQNNAATNLEYGTITNVGTKMDQEIDPDTGVEKIVGEVEVETSDDTSELQTAINAAVKAFTNPNNINVTSVTIEKVDDDDIKDSVEVNSSDTLQEDEGTPADGLVEGRGEEELDKAFMDGKISYEEYNKRLQALKDEEDAERAAEAEERAQKRQAERDAEKVLSNQSQETLQDMWSKTYKNGTLDYKLDSGFHIEIKPNDKESIDFTIMGPTATISYDRTKDLGEQLKSALTNLIDKSFSLEETPIIGSAEGDFSEEAITEESDIEVKDKKVITKIDGQTYEKDFSDDTQAKLAASGVSKGKLDPSTILPDEYEGGDEYGAIEELQEELGGGEGVDNSLATSDDLVQMKNMAKKYLDRGDNRMALAILQAIDKEEADTPETDSQADINQSFVVDDEPGNSEHIQQNDINIKDPVKLDAVQDSESTDAKEVIYTKPTEPSDDLVEPEKQSFVDSDGSDVIVELSDISYDVDSSSDFDLESGDEYENLITELNNLPDTLEIQMNAKDLDKDSDIMTVILDKAHKQTGLPIKNAKIADIKDLGDN